MARLLHGTETKTEAEYQAEWLAEFLASLTEEAYEESVAQLGEDMVFKDTQHPSVGKSDGHGPSVGELIAEGAAHEALEQNVAKKGR